MSVTVYVASAFSKNQKGGNKAGVVLMDQPLSAQKKMAIAKELGYAETAYISDSEIADYKIEYFTPKEEVDLCGHATIGSFVILNHLNKLSKGNYTIETNSGVLNISIKDDMIFMEQNQPEFYDVLALEQLAACFDPEAIADNLAIQIVSTGLKDILVPIKTAEQLHQLQPNFSEIKTISDDYDVVGMHLYAFNDNRIICRNFAPRFDIDEEAATGTSNCALACFLHKNNILRKETYAFEQGYALNLPSEIMVTLGTDVNETIEKVSVGGKGYYCETKLLEIE
ncbi:PhzF family phenazine biosynthesis protein [Vagococcus coleopterorum]|uniref:PhzF family phenazine biosynthesis protein n=1 Tax=Vagococcus coleopterorum TaxID=2714946 RepID=A0A6G8AMK2_9ENTE|nr:PhzF family phenazine biosynthesis protein [Vagococcus coleopterorum]QIL46200.1 PhzF family phenazine biosynthesis protein [Vagococcus coleopterorum]